MMRLLVSARSVDEALLCASADVDFIDLKEPSAGALGGLPVATIAAVVRALRAAGHAQPVSATIGDWSMPSMQALPPLLSHVDAVAACGVSYVKVGIAREDGARALIDALAAGAHAIVPVFIADRGIDERLLSHTLALRRFPALMIDTADKRAGSLFDVMDVPALARFVARVRAHGALAGLAGALRLPQLPRLRELAPDFAGFRSAACAGTRSDALDGQRLRELIAELRRSQASIGAAPLLT